MLWAPRPRARAASPGVWTAPPQVQIPHPRCCIAGMCKGLSLRTQTLFIRAVDVLVSGTLTSSALSDDLLFTEGTLSEGALSEVLPLSLSAGKLLAAKLSLGKL